MIVIKDNQNNACFELYVLTIHIQILTLFFEIIYKIIQILEHILEFTGHILFQFYLCNKQASG